MQLLGRELLDPLRRAKCLDLQPEVTVHFFFRGPLPLQPAHKAPITINVLYMGPPDMAAKNWAAALYFVTPKK